MSVRLDWTVGPAGSSARLPGGRPRPSARSAPRRLALATLYVTALVLAGTLGVALGRRQHAIATNLQGIANQLEVEDLAWAEADVHLYASTLDPTLPEATYLGLLQDFQRRSPRNVRHTVLGIEFLNAGLAWVTLVPGDPTAATAGDEADTAQQRLYRRVGRSWQRSAIP